MPRRAATFVLAAAAWVAAGCGDSTGSEPFVRPSAPDASPDAAADGLAPPADAAPSDPTLGGPCLDDGQCNDGITCTFDVCDFAVGGDAGVGRCRFTPDDAQCADDVFCNGTEVCVRGVGCRPGPAQTCQDQDSCTIDTCVEATRTCAHAPRDLDGDGDPDDRCHAARDCDDANPNVASTRAEVCENDVDDNCNGSVDETPCATAAADTCPTALGITAPGTYALSTVAAGDHVPLGCAASGKDVVAAITVPAGANRDVDVWAHAPGADLALALQAACGAPTDLTCRNAAGAVRARARNVAPGTYWAVVKTTAEVPIELAVDFLPASAPPTNETCAAPQTVTVGTAFAVSLVDAAPDVPASCGQSAGELTYRFTLAQASDVRVYTSVLEGGAAPVVTLRAAPCSTPASELRCREGVELPLFARNVPAGTYFLTVGAASAIDASVLVSASAPTTAPANEKCAAAPPVVLNGATVFDLDAHDDDVIDGCFEGTPDAAYALTLTQASDVLVVGRFPPLDTGAVALNTSACTSATRLACAVSDSPARLTERNVPAGDYRVVVSDRLGRVGSVSTFVRNTIPPVTVSAADGCSAPHVIPPTGGYFVGSTATAIHDFTNGCDQANSPGSGDLLFSLVLTQPRRVVFDMTGSSYTTLLSVRAGAACPGTEVAGACHVGYTAGRSFLERELAAGTYWIVVDGFNGEVGDFALDVRIVDP